MKLYLWRRYIEFFNVHTDNLFVDYHIYDVS